MTYDAIEKSEYGGRPAELYRFTMGSRTWLYTSGDADVVIGTDTYLSGWPIKRSEPEFDNEPNHQQLKIDIAMESPLAQLWVQGAPYESLWVTIYRCHIGDLQTFVIWQGKVRGCVMQPSNGTAQLDADSIEKVLGKPGLRQTFGLMCNKRLYSARCGASEALHTVYATLSAISSDGTVITIPEAATKADDYFQFGELYINELNSRVQILGHTGSAITIKRPILGLDTTMTGRIVAGCNHVWTLADGSPGDCKAKFANQINFGGFPFSPRTNPYETGIEG